MDQKSKEEIIVRQTRVKLAAIDWLLGIALALGACSSGISQAGSEALDYYSETTAVVVGTVD